jgi:two-component system sensor histidine kinase HydH
VAERERELARNRQALVVAERRALSGIFAAAVAHDINNTLSVFHGGLDELAAAGPSEPVRHMQVALDGLQKMTAQLLQASRDNGHTELLDSDLAAIVRDAVSFGRIHSRIRHCRIEEKVLEAASCHAHPSLLRQMVLNLLLNAAEATGGKGRILVTLEASASGGYSLSVGDDGPGVPPEYRERLFQPFFTTKTSGTGLGLLSVKAAAQAHGGSVEYATSELGGACFRVLFPTRFKD